MMTISMYVFSGRPDPVETFDDPALEASVEAELSKLVQATSTEAIRRCTETFENPGLGYKGIRLSTQGKELVLFKGLATVVGTGSLLLFWDEDRAVEKMLLGVMKHPVAATTLAEIK